MPCFTCRVADANDEGPRSFGCRRLAGAGYEPAGLCQLLAELTLQAVSPQSTQHTPSR